MKRKEHTAKNERQHTQNLAKTTGAGAGTGARKRDIDRTLAMTWTSTASMGKFDGVLDGENKLRGVMRKVSVPLSMRAHSSLSPQFDSIVEFVLPSVHYHLALHQHGTIAGTAGAVSGIRIGKSEFSHNMPPADCP